VADGSIMADRQLTCPVARPADVPPAMLPAAAKWESVVRKWRSLAERRSAHHIEMFNSGRWKHYYTDEEFLVAMRSAIVNARNWGALAPTAEERASAAAEPGMAPEAPPPDEASAEIELRRAA
jgi:uncharacterized repeat protein (TIGR03809 family)